MTSDHDSRVRLRAALDGLPPYRPGKPATVLEGVTAYKISSNENPYPPLPSVAEVAVGAVANINRYPDATMSALRERLASHLEVTAEEVIVGAGSSGVLSQIMAAAVGENDEVVYAWRSFELYPILVGLAGARSVQVPLTAEGRHDLPAMAEAVGPATRLLLVCTPNNPTGPSVGAAELDALLRAVPRHVLVVVDEAYTEFVTDEDAAAGLEVYAAHPNVVLLRTFSKAYGLAGLRVGYALAHPAVATELRKAGLPFVVTEIAQRAAVASLDAHHELDVRVKELIGERRRVLDGLRDQGWDVPDTQANFVWLPLGADALDFADYADARGLSVRPFAGEGVRCSIDVPEANTRLLEVTASFRADRS